MDQDIRQKLEALAREIQKITPDAVREFNEKRLGYLEKGWGESLSSIINKTISSQKTQEKTKLLSRPINNCFIQQIQKKIKSFSESNADGHDYEFDGIRIEDKNTLSSGDTWTGNGYPKSRIHLLKKFSLSNDGLIEKAFICLIELNKSKWTAPTSKSNFSTLHIKKDDQYSYIKIWGEFEVSNSFLSPKLQEVN